MLYTKSQGHQRFGSGEEEFLSFFTIFGNGGHLSQVTRTVGINFCFPIPCRLHMKFGFNRPSGFWGDDVSMDDRQMTDRRTTEAYLSYKLTNEPLAQVSSKWCTYKKRSDVASIPPESMLLNISWWQSICTDIYMYNLQDTQTGQWCWLTFSGTATSVFCFWVVVASARWGLSHLSYLSLFSPSVWGDGGSSPQPLDC